MKEGKSSSRYSTRRHLTYQDSRIIRHIRLRLSVLFLLLGNLYVLDIAPSKDNIVELLIGGGDEVLDRTTLGAEGIDIFQRNRRLLRVDFVKSTDITNLALGYEVETLPEMVSTRNHSSEDDPRGLSRTL
jgi:hypothetical protein